MTSPVDAKYEPAGEAASAANPTAPNPRLDKAHGIVRKNMYWALGMGFVPVPLLDLAAVTAVQVKMLKDLSDLYAVRFTDDKAKTVVASLVAGLGGRTIAGALAGSLFKVIPVIGPLVGAISGPVLAGALTVAVGNLFTAHYEAGGTLLDLDVDKVREHFRKEFEKAKETVRSAQQSIRNRGGEQPQP